MLMPQAAAAQRQEWTRGTRAPGEAQWTGVDLVRDFGGLGDGVSDNSAAFQAFGAAARALSNAGKSVRLTIPAGRYQYDAKKCFGFLFNIRQLHIVAHGASVQNTYDTTTANSNYEFPWPQIHSYLGGNYVLNNEGALIAETKVGDDRIVLKSTQDMAEFPVGAYILIASLNIQYMGYPHNCDSFDYAVVIACDPVSGTLVLDRKLRYVHRTDFPELHSRAYCSGPHVGRARVWNMNRYERHDVDHLTEGLVIMSIANKTRGYHDIFHGTGRQQVYRNCTFPGYGASNIEVFRMENCVVLGHGEIDKLIDLVEIDGCRFEGGLNFQSSSVERVVIANSSFSDRTSLASLYTGTAKNIRVENCEIDVLSEGLILGLNRQLVVANSRVKKWGASREPYGQFGDMQGPLLDVDGIKGTFADGVFKFRISAASILRNQALIYNAIPGAMVNLAGPDAGAGPMLTGSVGTGTVTAIEEEDAAFVMRTTLAYKVLPDWCPAKFRIQRCGQLEIINSDGCDLMRAASKAHGLGRRPFEYRDLEFSGVTERSGHFFIAGCLKRLVCNVVSPAASGQTIAIVFAKWLDGQTFRDAGRLVLTIDLSILGKRVFDDGGIQAVARGDGMSLGGVIQAAIPTGNWLYQNAFWSFNFDPAQIPLELRPKFSVAIETDMGRFRTIAAEL